MRISAHIWRRLHSLGATLWRKLTDPSTKIASLHEQHQARLLAALLFFSALLMSGNKLFRIAIGKPENFITHIATTIIIALMVIAYGFSRTQRYRIGVFIIAIPLSATIIIQGGLRATFDPSGMIFAILWLVPVVLFASLQLSVRATVGLIMADFVAVILVIMLIPGIEIEDTRFPLDFIGIVGMLIIVSGALRENYHREAEKQRQALTESEERYRSLMEASSEGVIVHQDGILKDANAVFLNLVGYTLPEVVGKSVRDFVTPESLSSIKRAGVSYSEMTASRSDGSSLRVETRSKQIAYRGKLMDVLTLHDISERKRVERMQLQLGAERERSEVLRQFISDASHDLRTPLTTINTSLYLMRKVHPDTSKIERYLNTVQSQVIHLNQVIESLLLMARLDDPDTYYTMTVIDLNHLTRAVVAGSQSAAQKKAIRLELDLYDAPLTVRCDEAEIQRALRLLLDNALRYTPNQGKVTVRTCRERRVALIEVEDNGPGINAEDLPHIFERFYRGDKARQPSEDVGVGLGLPIARKIVETHGGTLDVETGIQVGSKFQIYLPLRNA